MKVDFKNNTTAADKLSQFHNDRLLRPGDHAPTTLHQMASLGVDFDLGGRFSPGGSVTGSEPTAQQPRLPANSPWGDGPQPGLDPPLGVEIDQQEPTGTPQEVSASIEALAVPTFAAGEVALSAAPLPASSPGEGLRDRATISQVKRRRL